MQNTEVVSPSPPPDNRRAHAHLLLRKARSHRIVLDHVGLDPTFAYMIVGFHAQQAIEKFIKAVLSHNQIAYPRVNDLDRLLQLLDAEHITQPPGAQHLVSLTPWATRFRYEEPPRPVSLDRRATVTLVDDVAARESALMLRTRRCPEPRTTSRRPTTFGVVPLGSRRGAVP